MTFSEMPFLSLFLRTTFLGFSLLVQGEDTLFSGEKLLTNQFLENGPYRLYMQGDCNLVLYSKQGTTNKAIWASGTVGYGNACTLLLQSNGNLVVFSGPDMVWSSASTRVRNNYRLVLQGDANLVVYGGSIWASNTVQSSRKSNMTVGVPSP